MRGATPRGANDANGRERDHDRFVFAPRFRAFDIAVIAYVGNNVRGVIEFYLSDTASGIHFSKLTEAFFFFFFRSHPGGNSTFHT